jgi:hypothetical protein
MTRKLLAALGATAVLAGAATLIAGAVTGASAAPSAPAAPATPTAASAPARALPAKLTLQMARAYTPQRVNGATDDYRCFVLDPKLDQDAFVTSAHIEPGQTSLVHHVILFKESGAGAAAAIAKDKETKGKGWTCFGGPGLGAAGERGDGAGGAPWLSAWVPGRITDDLPQGIGVLLPKGSRIVMQVHYNLLNGARPDRSRVELKLQPATAKLAAVETLLLVAPVELPCPVAGAGGATGAAGAAAASSSRCERGTILAENTIKYGLEQAFLPTVLQRICGKTSADYPLRRGDATDLRTSCDTELPSAVTVRGVAGHMHLRGRDIRLTLVRASGEEVNLLHIPDWDFHWQDVYYLQKPIDAAAGDTLRVSCVHDNSPAAQPVVDGKPLPPRYVLWGEGTTDEMCLGIALVTAR